jgi:Leucine-rich repeat (LRR) protein
VGTIPPNLGILKNLTFLGLAYNNLSGNLPVSLYNLYSMEIMQIYSNMLGGSIATNIGSRFPHMQTVRFAENQFTGHIPASLSNLTSLQDLELS